MNTAVFGKTMENARNRANISLAPNDRRAIKLFSKINYKGCSYINGVYLSELYQKKIFYDKPIYVGTAILDLSKVCMMDHHYNVMEKSFPGRHNLIYSDTDSLVYSIRCDDIYKWMNENLSPFDLSATVRPEMQDNTNKKVIGRMKVINSLSQQSFLH